MTDDRMTTPQDVDAAIAARLTILHVAGEHGSFLKRVCFANDGSAPRDQRHASVAEIWILSTVHNQRVLLLEACLPSVADEGHAFETPLNFPLDPGLQIVYELRYAVSGWKISVE